MPNGPREALDGSAAAFTGRADRVEDERIIFRVERYWKGEVAKEMILEKGPESDCDMAFLEKGVYVNYLGEEGATRIAEAYGANYERLAALKTKYDPTNFFCLNQNIKPA